MLRALLLVLIASLSTETAWAQSETADPSAEVAAEASPAAGDWSSKGDLAIESRLFRDDDNGATKDWALGMAGRLEARYKRGMFQQKTRGFGRLDAADRERSQLIPEEIWAELSSERLRLRAGFDVINWTATEAFHPADIINARNFDSDLENMEKVGELMLSLQTRVLEDTTVSLMYMPMYTSPRFTSPASRLHFGIPGMPVPPSVRIDRAGKVSTSDFGHQGAVNIRQVIGNADVSLHAVEHLDRSQPVVAFDGRGAFPSPVLIFQTVRQIGGTYQHVVGPLILKLEGAWRWFVDPQGLEANVFQGLTARDHGQIAAGIEYGIPHGEYESTLIAEGQAMVGISDKVERKKLSPFQRDVMVGWRFVFNDAQSREFLLGAIFDLETKGEYIVTVNYQQRLGDTWTLRAGLRIFQAPAPDSPLTAQGLQAFRESDHLRLTLTRHF